MKGMVSIKQTKKGCSFAINLTPFLGDVSNPPQTGYNKPCHHTSGVIPKFFNIEKWNNGIPYKLRSFKVHILQQRVLHHFLILLRFDPRIHQHSRKNTKSTSVKLGIFSFKKNEWGRKNGMSSNLF